MKTINELISDRLKSEYARVSKSFLTQINSLSTDPNSPMQKSLKELDEEVSRLQSEEEKLESDNEYLIAGLDQYGELTNTTADIIQSNSSTIQDSGISLAGPAVMALVFAGLTDAIVSSGSNPLAPSITNRMISTLASQGVNWTMLSSKDFTAGYINSQEWIDKMNKWGAGYAGLTNDTLMMGLEQGWGPIKTARMMRQHAENIPLHAAENITRTLQLTAFRAASASMEMANAQYIDAKIRISALGATTCLACVHLHGTVLAPGEMVEDHYRGYCSEWYRVPGGPMWPEMMQADSTPGNRNFVPFQKGDDWFNGLSKERQAQQVSFMRSLAKWRAFQDGTPLSAFVGNYVDPVFGNQVIENSLIRAIGDDAEQYYTINK